MADWCMAHPWMTFLVALLAVDSIGGFARVVYVVRKDKA